MKVAFLANDKKREHDLANAVLKGASRRGHDVSVFPVDNSPAPGEVECVAMVGVKNRELFYAHRDAGARVLYLDKGYTRGRMGSGSEYWRVAIDAQQPTERLGQHCDAGRTIAQSLRLNPWRKDGRHILVAGSSAKYHAFHRLSDPTTFTVDIVAELQRLTGRPIVYRPKPSWRDAVRIPGTRFSDRHEPLGEALRDCWAMVTHGSNACVDSVMAGVPCIVLGNGAARPLSSTSLNEIEAPRLAGSGARKRWLNALSWWQYTAAEFASGEAWAFLDRQFLAGAA